MANGVSTVTPKTAKLGESDILGLSGLDPNTALLDMEIDPTHLDKALYRAGSVEPSVESYGTIPKAYERILGEDNYHPEFGSEYNASLLAREQGRMRQLGSALNQAIVGEIVGGSIEATGYLLDFAQYADLVKGTEEEFGNALSDMGKALKEWTRETTPVYVDPTQKDWAPERFSWWMANAPSIASTLSLLIPSGAFAKGSSMLAKGLKLLPKSATGQVAFRGVTQAIASRHMENMMEASQVYEEVIQSGLSKKEAAIAASNSYNKQWLLLLQDIPQYMLFNRFAGVGKHARAGKAASAAEKSRSVAAFMGYDPSKYFINKATSVGKTMIGEGFEEGYQYVVNEQSKLMAEASLDPAVQHSFGESLKRSVHDGELYTSMFFGALGAGAMLGAGSLMNKKGIDKSNEKRINDLKNSGQEYNIAYQNYSEALAEGNPVKMDMALNNMIAVVGKNSEQYGNTHNTIEMIEQLAAEDNTEALAKFGVEEQAGGYLQQNPDKAEQIIEGIKRVSDLNDRFRKEVQKNKNIKDEHKDGVALILAHNQFLQEKTAEQKNISDQKLGELKSEMAEFNKISQIGQQVEVIKSGLAALNGHTYVDNNNNEVAAPGLIKYYEDRLANKKVKGQKKGKLGAKEKARLENALARLKLTEQRMKDEIAELESNSDYTKAMKTNDTKLRNKVDPRAMTEYIKENFRNQAIEQSLIELEEDSDFYRTGEPLSSEEERKEYKEQKEAEAFDEESDFAIDDIVSFTDEHGNEFKGFVEDVELATEDTDGNKVEPSGNNGDNTYTLRLIGPDGALTGELVDVTGNLLTMEDKRTFYEDSFVSTDLSDAEAGAITGYKARVAKETENNGAPLPMSRLSYSHIVDGIDNMIEVRNPALNKRLSNPNTKLSDVRTNYELDLDDQFTQEYLRGENDQGKDLYSRIDVRKQKLLEKIADNEKLTESEITTVLSTTTGDSFLDVLDQLPIRPSMKIGKTNYKSGLLLHSSDFPYMSVPANIQKAEKETPGAEAKYKREKMFEARRMRMALLRAILQGKAPYTIGMEVGRGSPVVQPGASNNVAEVLNQNPNDVTLAVSEPKVEDPYNLELRTGVNTVAGSKNYSAPGAVYALTTQTVNGKQYSMRLNKAKIRREHAALIFEAFRLQGIVSVNKAAQRGKKKDEARYNVQFSKKKDEYAVTGLSTGEFLDIMVAHGRHLTDPDAPERRAFSKKYTKQHYQILANKRLYLDIDRANNKAVLVYGHNPITGQPFQIDLFKTPVHQVEEFYKWVEDHKTYRVNTLAKNLHLELNGDFLKGRGFTIGARNPITREKGDNYTAFLIKNKMVTTDAVRNEEGRLFHAPTVDLGLRIVKDNKGKETFSFETENRSAIISSGKVKTRTEKTKEAPKKAPVAKKGETLVHTKTDKRGRVTRFFAQTKVKDGLSTTIFNFNRSDKPSDQRNKAVMGIPVEEALSNKYEIVEGDIPEGAKVVGVVEIRETKDVVAATVAFEVEGQKFLGEVNLNRTAETTSKRKETPVPKKKEVAQRETKSEDLETGTTTKPENKKKQTQTKKETEGKRIKQEKDDITDNIVEGREADEWAGALPDEIADDTGITPEMLDGINEGAVSFDDFLSNLQSKPKKGGLPRAYTTEPYVVHNYEKELAWVNRMLNVPLSEVQRQKLGELMRKGHKNFGLFTRDAILIYEAAEEGTLYHEGFHRVSQGYLSVAERRNIYRLARQFYKMPDATDRQIEEVLAEAFREYVINKEENKDTSLIGRIKRWFEDMYNFIRALFIHKTGKSLSVNDINGLFSEIYKGRFRFAEMTPENYERIGRTEFEKRVGDREFVTITTHKQVHTLTKFLVDQLIELNDVVHLEDAHKLKWEPVLNQLRGYTNKKKEHVPGMIDAFTAFANSSSNKHTAEQKDRAARYAEVYKEVVADIESHGVDGSKSAFVTKVGSYLRSLGVVQEFAKEYENESDPNKDGEVVGKVDVDKKVNYRTDPKDNARTSIKFLVARTLSTDKVDPAFGLKEYVQFDEFWHMLLHHLHHYDTLEEMLDVLDGLGETLTEGYKYIDLADRLRREPTEIQTQFLTTFRMHRHEYLTFLFTNPRTAGTAFTIVNSSLAEAYKQIVGSWYQPFALDNGIVEVNEDGTKQFNVRYFEDVVSDFEDMRSRIDTAVEEQDYSEETALKIKNDMIDTLELFYIDVDVDTINELLKKFTGEQELDSLNSLASEMKNIFTGNLFVKAARNAEKIEKLEDTFFKTPLIIDLGTAHAKTHPDRIPDGIRGAENHRYFTYANNNMITDITRRIDRDQQAYVEEKMNLIYNRGSMVFEQMMEEGFDFDNFGVVTFSSMEQKNSSDTGRDYISITRLEDYLVRFSAIANGYLTMPILADRKQYYLMKGIKTYKDALVSTAIDPDTNKRSYTFSEEVVDRFYKYYLDEKDRITAAKQLREKYKAAETDAQREVIEEQMVMNYHYVGNFNVDSPEANAYRFVHFKGFSEKASATVIKNKIKKLLATKLEEELDYASKIDIIWKDGVTENLSVKKLDGELIKDKANDLDNDGVVNPDSEAIRHLFADFLVNTMVGVYESEKVFFADPAFFKKNKESNDVNEDMYKRWFGAGSTGMNVTERTAKFPKDTYSVLNVNTQKFHSNFLPAILKKQTELYEEYLKTKEENKDLTAEELTAKAKSIAQRAIDKAYNEVDPTDGQMFIAPDLYRSIADRLGLWTDEMDNAFDLLQADRELTVAEEIAALDVVLQPLKLVYIGKETQGNLDVVTYDKMSMATLFRRQVKDTHLERLLDRMEGRETREGKPGVLPTIDAIKFDTATKIGGRYGVDLFKDGQNRVELNEITRDATLYHQRFEHLKHQVVTDVHEIETQTVGSQMFKIASMNINREGAYGEFGNGQQILNKLTNSRVALSNLGVQEINAKFDVKNGTMSDEALITRLRLDAEQAGKTDDFQRALRTDENNKSYLQLDSFPDRNWVYTRVMSIINGHTIDLNMPGNQLIQVSDYGHNSEGLQDITEFKKELNFITLDEDGTTVHEMDARVSINLVKRFIPNYENLTWKQKQDFVKNKLKVIGYRIPTQGQNSIVRLNIVELLPEQGGDTIQLPLEFTTLTGSDFDIDKLFVMTYNYYTDDRGRVRKYKFIEGTDEKSVDRRYYLKKRELMLIHNGNTEHVPTREAFESWSIEEQNIKQANQNRILDIFYEILGNENHFLETTTPLGRSTGTLRNMAEKYERDARGNKSTELTALETGTPKFQSATKFIFTGSKQGIGPFALANAHHSLTQQADLGMTTGLRFGWNEDTLWLNRVRGEDGVLISDWLSALIDAHVDAVKDPYIIKLNVNEATYNPLNFLLRIGLGKDSFALLSQPIVKEYAEEFFNARGRITAYTETITSEREAAYEFIKDRWSEKMGIGEGLSFEFDESNPRNTLEEALQASTLESDIVAKNQTGHDYLLRQMNILEHFKEISEEADNLTRLVMASRIDTKKFGATPAELRAFLAKIKALESDTLAGTRGSISKWINLDRFISSDGVYHEGSTMLAPLLKNSLNLALDLMSSKSVYASSGFNNTFWSIIEAMPNGRSISNKDVKHLTDELYSFFAAQFFTDKVHGLGMTEKYIKKLFSNKQGSLFSTLDKIKRGKHKYSKELVDNSFINALTLDYNENAPGPFKTFIKMPFRSFKDAWQADDYIDSFNELFTHKDAGIRKLGKDLFAVSFFTSGFKSRANTFHTYIPLEVFKSLETTDGVKVSFDNHIKKLLSELNNDQLSDMYTNRAREEIFRNNWENTSFVPTVSETLIRNEYKLDNDPTKLVGFRIEIDTKNGKLFYGANAQGTFIYAPFLRVTKGTRDYLLQYTGIIDGEPVYRITNKKGFIQGGTVLREYGMDSENSIINPDTIEEAEIEAERLLTEDNGEELFNTPYAISEQRFVKAIGKKRNFIHVPFVDQVATKRSALRENMIDFNEDFRGGLEDIGTVPHFPNNLKHGVKAKWQQAAGYFRQELLDAGITSTVEAIKQGYRTGTSRLKTQRVKEGATINVGTNNEVVLATVTKVYNKPLGKLLESGEMTREQWSEREGWTTDYIDANPRVLDKFPIDFVLQSEKGSVVEDITNSGKKINIYAGTGENADLSNFASRPFTHDLETSDTVLEFESVEQAFQYIKGFSFATATPKNKNILDRILETTSGAQLKKLGRELEKVDVKGWDRSSSAVMRELLLESFKQNPEALNRLVSTENATLTHTQDKGKWGREFPRLLMEVRAELRPTSLQKTETATKPAPTKAPIYTPDTLSTPKNRFNVFADGSVIRTKGVATDWGYGAHSKFANRVFQLSGNKEAVNEHMKEFAEGEYKMSSDLVELLATLEALKPFENTAEHITVLQDNNSAVNYGRVLWERSAGSQSRQESGPMVVKKPHLQNIVNAIEKVILRIEKNGGSVRLKYIPAHHGDYQSRVNQYADTFKEPGSAFVSNDLVALYSEGNARADALARDTKNRNTFDKINAPVASETRTTINPTPEELESGKEKRKECNNG